MSFQQQNNIFGGGGQPQPRIFGNTGSVTGGSNAFAGAPIIHVQPTSMLQPSRGRGRGAGRGVAPPQTQHQAPQIIRGGGRGNGVRGGRGGRGQVSPGYMDHNQPQHTFGGQPQHGGMNYQGHQARGRGGHSQRGGHHQQDHQGYKGNKVARGGAAFPQTQGNKQQHFQKQQQYQKPQDLNMSISSDQSMADLTQEQPKQSTIYQSENLPSNGWVNPKIANQSHLQMSQSVPSFPKSKSQVPASLQKGFQHPAVQHIKPLPSSSSQPKQSQSSSLLPKPKTQNPAPPQQPPIQVMPMTKVEKFNAPATPIKASPELDEEEEYEGQDNDDDEYGEEEQYYDDEYYGEEGEDEYDEEADDNFKPTISKDILNALQQYKQLDPTTKDVCLHFVTDSCKYGEQCRERHDLDFKKKCLAVIKKYQKPAPSKKSSKQSVEEEKKKPDAAPASLKEAPKKVDLGDKPKKIIVIPKPALPVIESVSTVDTTKKSAPSRALESLQESKELGLMRQPSLSKMQPTILTSADIQKSINFYLAEFQSFSQNPGPYQIPKALSVSMCPQSEIKQGMGGSIGRAVSPFETDSKGNNFELLSLKEYTRSAADKEMNDPEKIRGPKVLLTAVDYIRDCIVDLDRLKDDASPYGGGKKPSFYEVYSFCRDRVKSICQDFLIIDQNTSVFQIKSIEQIIRYMICAIHDGFTVEHFDFQQHKKIIVKDLTNLIACYDMVRLNYTNKSDQYRLKCLENEVEFRSYQLIIFSNDKRQLAEIINQLDIGHYPKEKKAQLREAIKISVAQANDSFSLFFRHLMNTKYYLFACLMLLFLNEMRKEYLEAMICSYRQDSVSLSFVMPRLLFEDSEDALTFVQGCGFKEFDENDIIISKNRLSDMAQNELFKKWIQFGGLPFMDDLRGTKSRREIMQGSDAPVPQRLHYEPPQPQVVKPIGLVIKPKPVLPDPVEVERKRKEEEEKKERERIAKEENDKKEAEAKEKKRIADELEMKRLQEEKAEKLRLAEIQRKEELEKQRKLKIKKRAEDNWQKFRAGIKDKVAKDQRRTLLEFFKTFRSFIGKKRRVRAFPTDEEDQIVENYLEQSLEAVKSLVLSKKASEAFEAVIDMKAKGAHSVLNSEYSIRNIIENLEAKGALKAKLIYHHSLLDTAESGPILKALKSEILDINPPAQGSVEYIFKSMEFPQIESKSADQAGKVAKLEKERATTLMHNFMGSNLIVVFSTMGTIQGDIKKMKQAFSLCPIYTQFVVLWIVHKQSQEKDSGQEAVEKNFQEELKSQKISTLRAVTVHLSGTVPTKKQTKKQKTESKSSSKQGQVSVKNAVLAFIIDDLEASIKACSVFPIVKKKSVLKVQSIGDALTSSLDVLLVLINSTTKMLPITLRKVALVYFQDDNLKKAIKSPVNAFNALLMSLKMIMQPIEEYLTSFMKQVSQQFKYSEFNLNSSAEAIKLLPIVRAVTQMNELPKGDKYQDYHQVIQRLSECVPEIYPLSTLTQIKLQAGPAKLYDSTFVDSETQGLYSASKLFTLIFSPYINSLVSSKVIFFESLPLVDFKSIEPEKLYLSLPPYSEKAEVQQKPKRKSILESASKKVDDNLVIRRQSPIGELQEEIKNETNLNSSMNKKRLRATQFEIETADHICDFNERHKQRNCKMEQECLPSFPNKRQKTSQSAAWKSSNELDDSLASHEAYLKEMKEFVNKKPGKPLIKM